MSKGIEEVVREKYAAVAASSLTNESSGVQAVAEAFGYTDEDLKLLVGPMARQGEEPVGSMGNDAALAVLSDRPRLLYDYFAQLFLGAASEAANRRDDARRAYERAAALAPEAQSPRLSLSQLAARAGDRRAAMRALEPMLEQPSGVDDRSDPWWAYATSQGRAFDALMIEARKRLSTLHGAASPDAP